MSKDNKEPKSWLERFSQALLREPQDREQLVHLLRDAQQRHLVDADTLAMLEGVIQFSELQVRDIMIPQPQVVVIESSMGLKAIFKLVQASGHSRFPVIGSSRDEILGILHAKDLLPFRLDDGKKFDLDDLLRPPTFVPESKRLNILLTEFRNNRNHMAVVVDEYGQVSGFVTIEDVLEQIVGDIEDEFDNDEDAFIKRHPDGSYVIKAHMPIEDFNEVLNLDYSCEEFDTVGGLVLKAFGHLPKRGDTITINTQQFKVINADNRRIKLLELTDERVSRVN